MKKHMASLVTILFFLGSSFSLADNTTHKVVIKKSNIVTKNIGVNGMTCVGCEVTLEKSMKKVHGVVSVKASASDKNAVIAYDKTKTDEATLTQMIKNFGYKPFKVVETK